MRAPLLLAVSLLTLASACSSAGGSPTGPVDAGGDGGVVREGGRADSRAREDAPEEEASAADAPVDAMAGDAGGPCAIDGEPGVCASVSACALETGFMSKPGYCPGPADIECCAKVPDVADNPPIPAGYELMAQSEVTPAMTSWAVMILDDPTGYPLFATATMTFGALDVLARVEWHPPDFQNSVVHRGVTLYLAD